MKRIIDLVFVISIAPLAILIGFVIAVFSFLFQGWPVIHWSKRVGQDSKIFAMPKFRTMLLHTPQVSTDKISGEQFTTAFGSFLRRTSLDELPQLISVISGDMSLVGPRPALFNQYRLIGLRKKYGVDRLRPGLTGLAQITIRDKGNDYRKVEIDRIYLLRRSLYLECYIIFYTVIVVFKRRNISH